jgi:hypothetical protein
MHLPGEIALFKPFSQNLKGTTTPSVEKQEKFKRILPAQFTGA